MVWVGVSFPLSFLFFYPLVLVVVVCEWFFCCVASFCAHALAGPPSSGPSQVSFLWLPHVLLRLYYEKHVVIKAELVKVALHFVEKVFVGNRDFYWLFFVISMTSMMFHDDSKFLVGSRLGAIPNIQKV
jgi:hypothetical protein